MHPLFRFPLRILLAVVAILAIASKPAAAQSQAPGSRSPAISPLSELADNDIDAPYSVGLALTAPLVATAVSVGLIGIGDSEDADGLSTIGVVGLAIGPSLGHIYTGDWRGALIGTGLRVGGATASIMGVAMLVVGEPSTGTPLLVGGGLAAVGGTIYSIVDAPFSAVRANKEHKNNLSITPAPILGPSQSTGWGAQLQMTF